MLSKNTSSLLLLPSEKLKQSGSSISIYLVLKKSTLVINY